MASSSPLNTRASKRKKISEGLSTRSSARNNIATAAVGNNHNNHGGVNNNHNGDRVLNLGGLGVGVQQSNIGRRKRKIGELEVQAEKGDREREVDLRQSKKVKIAVEIASRPKELELGLGLGLGGGLGRTRSVVVNSTTVSTKTQTTQQILHPPPQRLATPISTATKIEAIEKAPSPPPAKTTPKKAVGHAEKVVNGIRHELDRLQPNPADLELKKDEKRKLRSQEDQWFKSELSAYLPEYDVVIGNIPKEENILELDTPIIVHDYSKLLAKQPLQLRKPNGVAQKYPLKEFPDTLFTTLHNAQRVDFSFMDRNYKDEGGEDPLSDAYFETIHRKPERLERTIRNADKGRAQHEKDQVMRLLEGLQGHDWLKLMGVTGVTESKKKEYEPARDHFIRGCNGLIEKFRWWKEEEKRRKLEKEAALAEAEEEEDDEEEGEADEEVDDNASDGDPPDYSDVDASAARQLHEEAVARSAPYTKGSDKRQRFSPAPQELEKDFVSFFKKPHLREAALGKHRRSGRSAAAWGHQVPEVPEADFDLPSLLEECNDSDYLKMHARRKRRDRRVSKN